MIMIYLFLSYDDKIECRLNKVDEIEKDWIV